MQPKPSIVSFYFLLVILFLNACNSNDSTHTDNATALPEKIIHVDNTINIDSILKNCDDVGSFTVKQGIAEDLMKHFDTVFRGFGSADLKMPLLDSFWIDSVVIASLSDFLVNNPAYDGARVYFGANVNVPYTTNIMLSPTTERVSSPTNKGHVDSWGVNVAVPTGFRPIFQNFVHKDLTNPSNTIDFKNLNPMRQLFVTKHREITSTVDVKINDSLSKAVWFNKCVILTLNAFLRNPANNLNGISVYGAAYRDSSFNTNHTQTHLNQSTFIIVPTHPKNPTNPKGHIDDWEIIPNSFMRNNDFSKRYNGNGYNHGELCPNSCN